MTISTKPYRLPASNSKFIGAEEHHSDYCTSTLVLYKNPFDILSLAMIFVSYALKILSKHPRKVTREIPGLTKVAKGSVVTLSSISKSNLRLYFAI